MTTRRLQPDDRRAQILSAAVDLAADQGFLSLTRDAVAKAAGVSPGLVTFYFFAVSELRRQVMQRAVENEHLSILAEGLAARDEVALSAPAWIKARAIATMGG